MDGLWGCAPALRRGLEHVRVRARWLSYYFSPAIRGVAWWRRNLTWLVPRPRWPRAALLRHPSSAPAPTPASHSRVPPSPSPPTPLCAPHLPPTVGLAIDFGFQADARPGGPAAREGRRWQKIRRPEVGALVRRALQGCPVFLQGTPGLVCRQASTNNARPARSCARGLARELTRGCAIAEHGTGAIRARRRARTSRSSWTSASAPWV